MRFGANGDDVAFLLELRGQNDHETEGQRRHRERSDACADARQGRVESNQERLPSLEKVLTGTLRLHRGFLTSAGVASLGRARIGTTSRGNPFCFVCINGRWPASRSPRVHL